MRGYELTDFEWDVTPAGKRRSGRKAQLEKTRAARPAEAKLARPDHADEDAAVTLTEADIPGVAEPVNPPLTFASNLTLRTRTSPGAAFRPKSLRSSAWDTARAVSWPDASASRSMTRRANWSPMPAAGRARTCRRIKSGTSCRRTFRRAGCCSICTASPRASTSCSSRADWSTFRLHALGVPVASLMSSSVSEE